MVHTRSTEQAPKLCRLGFARSANRVLRQPLQSLNLNRLSAFVINLNFFALRTLGPPTRPWCTRPSTPQESREGRIFCTRSKRGSTALPPAIGRSPVVDLLTTFAGHRYRAAPVSPTTGAVESGAPLQC